MKTISSVVESVIDDIPFVQEALFAGVLNYRAAADYLKNEVERKLKKEVKLGSIQMALMRYKPPNHITSAAIMLQNASKLGSLHLNVGLCCYTFKKSIDLMKLQSGFLNAIQNEQDYFYLFTYGFSECNLTFSKSCEAFLPQQIKMESIIKKTENLNAVNLKLPSESENIRGLYYILLKELTWNKVTLYDISSTANEITLIVKDKYLPATIESFKSLKFNSV